MGKASVPSPPTAPRKPSKYCTWPSPAPGGPGPAVSLVEAPGTAVLGSPHAPLPHPCHDGGHRSSQRVGKGLGLLASRCSIRNISSGLRGSLRRHRCALVGRSRSETASKCGLGRGKQAEGSWAGKSWATVDRVTPSTGGGDLCCRLGPPSRCCHHPRC